MSMQSTEILFVFQLSGSALRHGTLLSSQMGAWGTYSWLVDVGRGTASVNVLDRLLQPCRHSWHCKKCPNQPNCLLRPAVWSVIHTKHKSDPCNIKYSSVLECGLTGHKAEKRQIPKMQETKKPRKQEKQKKYILTSNFVDHTVPLKHASV